MQIHKKLPRPLKGTELAILAHHYCSTEPYPDNAKGYTIAVQATAFLVEMGLLAPRVSFQHCYLPTEDGAIFVRQCLGIHVEDTEEEQLELAV